MLIELSVANFRSFRERVTLSLEAEPRISERDKSVDERNVAHTADGEVLRVAAVYGANASGKSNLVTALATLRGLVLNSAREGQAGDTLPAAPFRLDAASLAAPSELEVVFGQSGRQVRYGVAFTAARVEREWLFVRAVGGAEDERWFERTRESYEVGEAWVRDVDVEGKTRAEALHLSVAMAWNHVQARSISEWFGKELRAFSSLWDDSIQTIRFLADEVKGAAIRALIRRLDFGVEDLQLATRHTDLGDHIRVEPRIMAIRQGVAFDLQNDESAGMVKAVALAGPVIEALAHGRVLVIDEFDARLHTC